MSIFNEFPYTNLHEMNLDWIISEVKAALADIDTQNASIEEIRELVENFIDTLDITVEVGDKLNEMYESGELADIITDVVLADISTRLTNLESEIEYIFPAGSEATPCGECMILKDGADAYIFDFGYLKSGTDIINAMTDAGITNIKGVVISHYHDDHIGVEDSTGPTGMIAVISAFTHDNMTAYLPHNLLNWSLMVGDFTSEQSYESQVVAYLQTEGATIVYPTEGQEVDITDTIKFRFNNLSQAKFSGYYSYYLDSTGTDTGKTTYNNFSMVTEIFHKNHKCVFTGDIQEPAEANNIAAVQGADIFVVEHHGLNRPVNEYYIAAVTPKVAVIPTGASSQGARTYIKTDIYKALAGCEQVVVTANNGIVTIHDGNDGILCETESGHNLNLMYAFSGLSYGRVLSGSGYDLDDFINPGEWAIQNATQAALIANTPWTNSGYKLQVIVATATLVVLQIAMQTGSNAQGIAIRRSTSGTSPTFSTDWVYIYPSEMVDALITDDDLASNITVYNNSFNQCHMLQYNNVIEISLDIQTSAAIASGTTIVTLDGNRYGRGCYFVLREFDTPANVYICRLTYSSANRNYYIVNNDALPSNVRLVGNVVTMAHATN